MRVLFVAPAPPWPPRRGYQQRTATLAAGLAARHRVAVVAQRSAGFPAGEPPAGVTVTDVALGLPARLAGAARFGWRRPGQVALHEHPALRRAVATAAAAFRPDVAVVVLARLGGVLPALDAPAVGVPAVLDLVDDLALNMRRRAAFEGWRSPFWRLEAARLERWTGASLARAAAATVVAERDRASLARAHPEAAAALSVVPLAVPVAAAPAPLDGPPVALLTGNLGYFPTRHGAGWLAREVWPRVRAALGDAAWHLAGSRLPRELARLDGRAGVRVIADPPDLAPILAGATVALAPLFAGSGTPIKVLEAIAAGVPVVATPAAAAGLDDLPEGALRVAGDPAAFAAAVVDLLRDRDAGRAQAARARAWLGERHRPERTVAAFESVLEQAAARR